MEAQKTIAKRNVENILTLSPMQAGLLVHYLKNPQAEEYFEQLSLNITGAINNEIFQRAWDSVVENNEMLRTVFVWDQMDKPIQIILKQLTLPIKIVDLSSVENQVEQRRLLADLKARDRKARFDLQTGPLMRIYLCKLKEDSHEMIISNHHIIYDGWSNGIILKEFIENYSQLSNGDQPIKVVKSRYQEYLKWLQTLDHAAQGRYWKGYLQGFESKTLLPIIKKEVSTKTEADVNKEPDANNEVEEYQVGKYIYKLTSAMVTRLEKLIQRKKITDGLFFYITWGILLQKYNNLEDVVFGTTVAGRPPEIADIEKMVGLFINTIPFRLQTSSAERVGDLLSRLQIEMQERQLYENTPLVDIIAASEVQKLAGLFDSLVVMENYPLVGIKNTGALSINSYSVDEQTEFDLTLQITTFKEYELTFIYNQSLFAAETIKKMAEHYANIIGEILANPEIQIAGITLTSSEEKEQLLYTFNNTQADFPQDKTIQQLFEAQVEKRADETAVFYLEEYLTYRELNDRANQLAHFLRELGVTRDSIVGIALERSLEMIIGIMGILKAGGAYVPIDPNYPTDRIAYILQDSQANIILTTPKYSEGFSRDIQVIDLTDQHFYLGDSSNLTIINQPTDLAYVIYTSGSTGLPKGVMIEHRSVINRLHWMQKKYPLDSTDTILQKTPFTFDVSVWELFWWSLVGAKLCFLTPGGEKDPGAMVDAIKRYQITTLHFVPSMLSVFLEYVHTLVDVQKLKSIKRVFASGEALQPEQVERFHRLLYKENGPELNNLYGPTEAAIDVTYFDCLPAEKYQAIPIGKPIDNIQMYVLDRHNNLQPIGIAGELCIAGVGLARGYVGKPELTQERFVPNPFKPGERMYKTGDLACWMPDGNIHFMGRMDYQVKIRGLRIELGEIEARLLEYPGIQTAVVIARKDANNNDDLYAYFVAAKEIATADLRSYLLTKLPDYMVPAYFMQLEQIPLTSSGKINRQALPEVRGNQCEKEYAPPTNQLEEQLVRIWSEVLGIERIWINDDFFQLGGQSLKAMQLTTRVAKGIKRELPLPLIFQIPTVKEQAKYLGRLEAASSSPIEKVGEGEYYPVSSAQKRMFIINQTGEQSTNYNMSGAMVLHGEVDVARIRQTLEALSHRHESLRTSFHIVAGQMVQKIHANLQMELEYLEAVEANMEKRVSEFVRPFALDRAPLCRVGLIKVAEAKHILLFDLHHIIADGISANILKKEFANLYAGNALPDLRIQYKDFAVWHNQFLQSERMAQQKKYWLELFAGEIPVLNLPVDLSRPAVLTYEGDQFNFAIGAELTASLKRLAHQQGATMYMTLLAAYNILLAKYSGQEDIVVGSPIAGRPHVDLENVIGMFVNTLAMRNFPLGDHSFADFLADVKARSLKAYEHQDYQFEMLVEQLNLDWDSSRNALFDVMFALENAENQEYGLQGLHIKPYDLESKITKYDLTLIAEEQGAKIGFSLKYRTKLFQRSTIERLARHFVTILQEITRDSHIHLAEIAMLSKEERDRLIFAFNDTAVEYQDKATIQQVFEKQVEKTPDQIAVVFEDNHMTYAELNQKANQLARLLREKGVGPDQVVGLMVDRSCQMILGIMGVIKAGGAYLPIDPHYPDERIKFLLDDAKTKILLTQRNYISKVKFAGSIIDLEEKEVFQGDSTNLQISNRPHDLAYVIYTSGTTGKPKGVLLEHNSVLNLLAGLQARIYHKYTSPLRVCLLAPYVFDASVQQIFAALLHGHSLYIVPDEVRMSGKDLLEFYAQNSIDISDGTPAHISLLVNAMAPVDKISVKHFIIGGEALPGQTAVKFLDKFITVKPKLTNIYGPAECCVDSTAYLVNTAEVKKFSIVPIGSPLANKRIYILDKQQKLVPMGSLGEIYISGEGLARGYHNSPDLTASKFVANPYEPGRQMYKTGDLGRWLADGNIEFVGRTDFQVKIRGYRIELGEIEAQLLTHPEITECLVLDREDAEGNKYLCAYLGSPKDLSITELRHHLAQTLPEYMIPSYFVRLTELPKTTNGKINRKALPEPDNSLEIGTEFVAPENEVEVKLAKIWSEVLGVGAIGVYDNFFELGGHSLRATMVLAKIFKELNVELPLGQIFKTPTIRGLAEIIGSSKESLYTRIEPVGFAEFYQLSSAQKRLFLLHQMEENSISYNLPGALLIEGQVALEKIESAFKKLIERHESLRTSFELVEGEPVQRVHELVEFSLDYQILDDPAEKFVKLAIQQFIKPFDLSQAPLLRAQIIKLAQTTHILMFDLHHIISDGTSLGVLINEFSALYAGEELDELPIQYKDYASWQNELVRTEEMLSQEEYWLNRFSGEIPVLNLPTDYARPAVQSYAGGRFKRTLDARLTADLHRLSEENDCTLYMTLLTAVNILLAKYTGQEDIIVGSPIAGRSHPDLARVIGMFVNTLALRNQPSAEKTSGELLYEVRENALLAYENQDYQFEELIDKLHLRRDLSRNPLFDVTFTLQNMEMTDLRLPDLQLTPYPVESGTAKFDLTFFASEIGDEILLDVEYCSKLFDWGTVEKMVTHLGNILQAMVDNLDARLETIEMLTEAEKAMLLYEFNQTATEYPKQKTIGELFTEQVALHPKATAVVFGSRSLTYQELEAWASNLAGVLQTKGVQAETIVGIMAERSLETVVGILAIIKAGGAYLPIDLDYPGERINYMLADCAVPVLLTQGELPDHLDFSGEIVDISLQQNGCTSLEISQQAISPENMAYVIYTSGSTGQPKGVIVEQRSIVRLIKNTNYIQFHSGQKILQVGTFTFDASTFVIWGALLNGLELHVAPRELILQFEQLEAYLVNREMDMLLLTTAVFNLLAEEAPGMFRKLTWLLTGGEAISSRHVQRIQNACPDLRIVNVYGPTENTTFSTTFLVKSPETDPISIGKPVANSTAYIFNRSNQLCPIGVAGELCVGGDGLARGYLNNPDLTSAKFIEHPYTGERIYRTGDLAKWLPDGNIEFMGRIDHQVKIRSYRIEPGEIESCLLKHDAIKEAIVLAHQDERGNNYLCAYIVPERTIANSDIRDYLNQNLPEYMIPAYCIQLETMPLNLNGKIDRKALPEPADYMSTGREYVAPRDQLEAKLVAIWAEVLGMARIGIQDNFFELGGHSLKATLLTAKIQKEFGVELPLSKVFQHATLEAQAKLIALADARVYTNIEPIAGQEYYPTSSAQRRLFIQNQFEGMEGTSYNMPAAILIAGKLDHERFAETFRRLVERHETLRTSFTMQAGEVVQKVARAIDFTINSLSFDNLEMLNESGLAPATGHNVDLAYWQPAFRQMLKEFVQPFDLSKAPLFRVGLAKLSAEQYVMFFDMHHIISDGLSVENIIQEFVALYEGKELPELRVQYKDFAHWQNELMQTATFSQQEEYWLQTFRGELPVLNLPTDYPRPAIQSFKGSLVQGDIDRTLALSLKELARETGTTLYMVLCAAFNLLLAKYTGQEDIVIGTPIAGRRHADLEKLVGMFVNMITLRNMPRGSLTFRQFLAEVKANTLAAFDHQDYQFEELVEKLNLRRDLSRNPLFDVVFSMQDATRRGVIEAGVLRLMPCALPSDISKFDLTLEIIEEVDGLGFSFEYCTDLFRQETIERLASHFSNLLGEVTQEPESKLAEINILSAHERRELLEEFNSTEMEFASNKTLHELFAEEARRNPAHIAVVHGARTGTGEVQLTYGTLNAKANQLACHLRELGVGRDEIVAIMAERSPDLLVAILGILKAGGAYMPIDPDYPGERIGYMLEDSNARIVLTHRGYAGRLSGLTGERGSLNGVKSGSSNGSSGSGAGSTQGSWSNYPGIILDFADPTIYQGTVQDLPSLNKPTDLAYVMYTSGSTGKPKGVMIEHRGVVSLATYYNQMFKLDQGKKVLHMSNIAFDTSVVEIFPPLLYGATVYIIDKELALDRERFIHFVETNQINLAQFVPLTLQEILGTSPRVECLESVIVGSDKLDDAVKDQILAMGYSLTNHYGPTEGTVDAVVAVCERGKSTIGKPIANTQVYILDKDLQLTPIGVPGELCIAGVGLARGYLGKPELTAEKFIPNPWRPGTRLYRTGDRASWQSDGNITFHGRLDNQVKIRGYRVEPGEIEQHLQSIPGITNAIVIDRTDASGMKYLAAYLVAEMPLSPAGLKTQLGRDLPEYMIPASFMQLERIPLTENGKVDLRALPEPEGGSGSGGEYRAPTNPVEEKLIAIWQKVLAHEALGIEYNFFEAGGHSLKALQVVNLVHKELSVQISLQDIFAAPTVKELARVIQSKEVSIFSAIPTVPKQDYYQLSYNQRRLWIISQLESESQAYNLPGRITLAEAVDESVVNRVFAELIQRHESLRTQFQLIAGDPVQVITAGDDFQLELFDLQDLSEEQGQRKREEIFESLAHEPFNLVGSSLLRAGLIKVTARESDIIFSMHHIISDGWSLEVLQEEFYLLYSAYKENKECHLQPLPIQYKDFAAWQNHWIGTPGESQVAKEYWMAKLRRVFPTLNLPQNYVTDLYQQRKSAAYRMVISGQVKDQLKAFAQSHKTSLFVALTTVLKMFLADLTGQTDIAIGLPGSGRQHENLRNVIGFFVNTIVLVNQVNPRAPFAEMLNLIHNDTLKALEYQNYPLELISSELKIQYPEIQVFINMLNVGQSHLETIDDTEAYHLGEVQEAKFGIMFYLTEYANGIEVFCTYLTGLYKPATIEYIVNEYVRFITRLITGSEEAQEIAGLGEYADLALEDDLDDDDLILTRG